MRIIRLSPIAAAAKAVAAIAEEIAVSITTGEWAVLVVAAMSIIFVIITTAIGYLQPIYLGNDFNPRNNTGNNFAQINLYIASILHMIGDKILLN